MTTTTYYVTVNYPAITLIITTIIICSYDDILYVAVSKR